MKTLLYAATAFAALTWAEAGLAATVQIPAEVDGVVITANRAPQRIDKVGGQITLIGPQAIRESQAVIATDLLSQTPGVTVSRNGPIGSPTQLRIRGAEGDQTVVLIDGVKLNDPSSTGGGYNFGNLLIGDVDHIEILRGAQSVLWGSQALGGVVNLITADPKVPFEADINAEVGSQHTAYARAGLGGASDRLVWRATASQYVTEGVSSFDKGGERDGYRNTGASAKARLILTPQASIDLRGVYSRGRDAFDGFPAPLFAFGDTAEYGVTEDIIGYAGLNLDLFGGRLKNRLAYAYTGTDRDSYNPAQAVTTRTFDATGRNDRWEYQGTLTISQGWSAVFGAETEHSSFRAASPSSFAPNPPKVRHSADLDGLYAQLVGEVLPHLTVAAGVRRDDHSTFGDSTVGQASVAYALNDGATVLRASWGQGFKAPTLYQLYSDYGNTRLNPEEAETWDVGVQQTVAGGRLMLSAAYFDRDTTNQIDFVSCAAGAPPAACISPTGARRFGFYYNTASTEAHGVELEGQAKVTDRLTLSANYTWAPTENTAAGPNRGKDLQRRPENSGSAQVTYVWPVKLSTSLLARYAGDSYDDAGNRIRLKSYTLVDLRAAYPVNDRLEVYARVENLGGEIYETIAGYGQPRRSGALGVRARF